MTPIGNGGTIEKCLQLQMVALLKVLAIVKGDTIKTDGNYKWRHYLKVPQNRIPNTNISNTLKNASKTI